MQSIVDVRLGLLVWMIAIVGVVLAQRRRGIVSAGLVVAYLLNLWMIHWLAATLELLPWYSSTDPSAVRAGFQQSVYGVIAFGIGAVFIGPAIWRLRHSTSPETTAEATTASIPDSRLVKAYIIAGLVSYLVIAPLIAGLPTLTSMVVAANQLLVVGLCLGCWRAWRMEHYRSFVCWLAAALGVPFLTIITQGFLAYGVVALGTVLMFIVSFSRPRWKGLAAAVLIGYIGLSLYVTYMRDRSDIRTTVWGGQSLSQRIAQLYSTFSTIEWFGWQNQSHLVRIDQRLNQNYLVGVAVNNLSSGYRQYAEGETFGQAALAVIPRMIWPEKTVAAGSPQLVTRYTGIQFAQNTSVGIGQVLEFYINFGTTGVIVGFLILGSIVALFDLAAARWLAMGDWQRFTFWFLPGLGFLQAGGSLVELTSTVAAGFATAAVVNWFAVPVLRVLADLPTRSNPQLRPAERAAYADQVAWPLAVLPPSRKGASHEDSEP